MRNRLLGGSAIGLALALSLGGGRPADAACSGVVDGGDNSITCVPFIPAPSVVTGLDGNDTITLDGVVVGLEDLVIVTGATGDDLISVFNGSVLGQLATGQAVLLGEDGDDRIEWFGGSSGSGGTATLDGGTGNDTFSLGGNAAVDAATLFGNIGQDTFLFGDVRISDASAATVDGGAGDDTFALSGSRIGTRTGTDGTIAGGAGNDSFDFADVAIGDQGRGVVDAGSGGDTLHFTDGSYLGREQTGSGAVLGGSGRDVFVFEDLVADDTINAIGYIGDGTLDMGDADDTLFASGPTPLILGAFDGADGTLSGGAGDDSIYGSLALGSMGNGTVLGGAGADLLSLESLRVGGGTNVGGTRSEGFVDLGLGSDTLVTTGAAFIGLVGAATLAGGSGDDTLSFASAPGFSNLVASNSGVATIDLGSGADRLEFLGTSFIGIASSANELLLSLGEGDDSFLLQSTSMAGAAIGAGTGTSALLLGGDGGDTLQIVGAGVRAEGGGQVTLDTGLGDDTVFLTSNAFIDMQFDATGGGQALITGGSGADSLVLSNITMGILGQATLAGGSGSDSIAITDLTQLANSVGATALVTGGQGADVLQVTNAQVGQAGSATLAGDSGADTLLITDAFVGTNAAGSGSLLGGSGQDTLFFDNADVGTNGAGMVDGGDAADVILLTNGTRLGVNTATASASLYGGGGDDIVALTASTLAVNGSATFDGGDGNDTLTLQSSTVADGPSALATLSGGSGADLMAFDGATLANRGGAVVDGGDDDDSFLFGGASRVSVSGTASLFGSAGNDTLDIQDSTVAIHGQALFDLGDDDDTLMLANATVAEFMTASASFQGGSGSDSLIFDGVLLGRDGQALLDGGAGGDSLRFLGGTQVAEGSSSQVTVLGGLGNDNAIFTAVTVGVAGQVSLDLGGGSDTLSSTGATFGALAGSVVRLLGGSGGDTLGFGGDLIAAEGSVSIGGGTGSDSLLFDGSDLVASMTGAATLFGGDDADLFRFSASDFGLAGAAQAYGDGGGDTLQLVAGSTFATQAGTGASYYGGDGADQMLVDASVLGEGGQALLDLGADADLLRLVNGAVLGNQAGASGTALGGSGDDTFQVTDSDVGVAAGASGTLLGDSGQDLFELTNGGFGAAGGALAEGGSGADLFRQTGGALGEMAGGSGVLRGGGGGDGFTLGGAIGLDGSGLVDGGSGADQIQLLAAAVVGANAGGSGRVLGGDGDDNLTALAAAIGAAGSATLDGGSGADSLDFAGSTLGVQMAGSGTVLGGSGADLIAFRLGAVIGGLGSGLVDAGLGDDGVTLDMSSLGGGGSGLLTGDDGDDSILLRNGATVGSGAGTGTLAGGSGADRVALEGATLGGNGRFLGEEGNDTLALSLASSLAAGSQIESGDGDDRVRIEDTTLIAATAVLDGGADSDTLELFGAGVGTFDGDGVISNFETLQKSGDGTWNWDRAGAAFANVLLTQGAFNLVGQTLAGATTIQAAAVLTGEGTLVGPLSNAGRIVPGSDGTFGVLTIDGDYTGGGLLALDVTLGADGSPADLLRITGTTGGATQVQVANIGGLGAESVGNGILVIEVGTAGGSSTDGDFLLSGGPVSAGMFEYGLVLQPDGNWYLTTNFMDETNDLSLAGAAAMTAWYAGLRSADERLGELHGLLRDEDGGQRAALGAGDAQQAYRVAAEDRPLAGWLRVGGAIDGFDGSVGTAFDQSTVTVQGGFDGGLRNLFGGGDILLLGAFASVAEARAEVRDSAAELDLMGYGGGLYATYLSGGLYIDAIFKAEHYDLDYSIPAIDVTAKQGALALGGSLEAGWRFDLAEGLWLEPQAQVTYLDVNLEDLPDLDGSTDVIFEDAQSLQGRIGLRLGGEILAGGATVRPYAEVSGRREFLGESKALIGDSGFATDLGGNALELGLGVSVVDATGRISLFLDGDYVTGTAGQSVQVQGGLRIAW